MTVKEKLMEELGAAVVAILGDNADKEFEEENKHELITYGDLVLIAKKVKFYMDL